MNDHRTARINVRTMLEQAMEMALKAARIQRKYFRRADLDIRTKHGEADIVTRADRESEQAITDAIRRHYPSHGILAEESGDNSGNAEWVWVIDPLDGTTNYAAGLPLFAVSIGIRYRGETVCGVVYAPYLDEMFTAISGQGAKLNGREIHASACNRLDRAVVSTGFPVDKAETRDNNLDNVARVMSLVRGLRRLGAASLDLCYVAAGILDGYWEMGLHEWDVCAGELIVREAGGKTGHFQPDRSISQYAAAPGLLPHLLPLLH